MAGLRAQRSEQGLEAARQKTAAASFMTLSKLAGFCIRAAKSPPKKGRAQSQAEAKPMAGAKAPTATGAGHCAVWLIYYRPPTDCVFCPLDRGEKQFAPHLCPRSGAHKGANTKASDSTQANFFISGRTCQGRQICRLSRPLTNRPHLTIGNGGTVLTVPRIPSKKVRVRYPS